MIGESPTRFQRLAGDTSGGGSGSDIALAIERHHAYGAIGVEVRRFKGGEGLGGRRGCVFGTRRNGQAVLFELADELLPAALGEEESRRHLFEVNAGGECIGAAADEHDVWRLFHDGAGERDGMAGALHIGNRAGSHRLAVHDRGVELVGAIGGKDSAAAGIEERIVFEEFDGCFDGIERRATFIEHSGGGERLLIPAR